MDDASNVTITGLQLIDYAELEEQLPPDTIRKLPAPTTPDGQFGEPTLIVAVIMVTAAAVHALAAWLARRRTQNAPGPGFTVTVAPDGTVMIKLTSSAETSTPSPKSVTTSDILGVLEEALRQAASLKSS